MTLKRKRSSSELPSSPLSSASTFSSPPSNSPLIIDFTPRLKLTTPCHLDSRTLKRFRDNRPSPEEIHQRTLELLYSAQQQPQYQDAHSPCPHVVQVPPEMEYVPLNTTSSSNQQSLHRFWNIKSQPTAAPNTTIEPMDKEQS